MLLRCIAVRWVLFFLFLLLFLLLLLLLLLLFASFSLFLLLEGQSKFMSCGRILPASRRRVLFGTISGVYVSLKKGSQPHALQRVREPCGPLRHSGVVDVPQLVQRFTGVAIGLRWD